jgi:hydroxyacylglutathione hydrolase
MPVKRLLHCIAVAGITSSVLPAQVPQPNGADLERGVLPASWSQPDSSVCATAPHFRLHEYNADFYILRQSGCTNYEKPFLYLIFGSDKVLLLDTGAKGADVAGAVRAALSRWAGAHNRASAPQLIVAHSHGHGDHVAGDSALASLPNAIVVGTSAPAVQQFFGIRNWPTDTATFDLGGRVLDVVPIPGHQPASIGVYDRRTGILLTGDTMYPGRLYVSDAAAFTASVHRLVDFTRDKPIAHVLGAHVEQARTPFLDYVVGTRYQPDEHVLELSRGHLLELAAALDAMNGTVVRRAFRDFTVWPTGR